MEGTGRPLPEAVPPEPQTDQDSDAPPEPRLQEVVGDDDGSDGHGY